MADLVLALSAMRAATAVLGALLAGLGVRAFLRERRRSLLLFATGATVLSLGYLLAGALYVLAGWSLTEVTALEAPFTFVAVVTLTFALFGRERHPRRSPPAPAPIPLDGHAQP